MATHAQGLPPGTRLDDYAIDKVLGSGGFGITYLAHDVALNRRFAIKEFFPREIAHRTARATVAAHGGEDEQAAYAAGVAAFLDEARMLAGLRHPGVVPVHRDPDLRSCFAANGTAYLVMGLVDGTPLSDQVKRLGALGPDLVLPLAAALTDALAYLHARDIIHRDIKPDNIMIGRDGAPVLIDFGSARAWVSEHSRSQTSYISAGYSPYEQFARRVRPHPTLDIYALSATLHRAITGTTPPPAIERMLDDEYRPLADTPPQGWARHVGPLRAIDAGLSLRATARPQTIADWRAMWEGSAVTRAHLLPSTATDTEQTAAWPSGTEPNARNSSPDRSSLPPPGDPDQTLNRPIVAGINPTAPVLLLPKVGGWWQVTVWAVLIAVAAIAGMAFVIMMLGSRSSESAPADEPTAPNSAALPTDTPSRTPTPIPDAVSTPVGIPTTQNDGADPDSAARGFFNNFLSTGSRNDLDAIRSLYASDVRYYGIQVPLATLIADKRSYIDRWPTRTTFARPDTLHTHCVTSADCNVEGLVDWTVANPLDGRSKSGIAEVQVEFHNGLIVAESSKVIARSPSPF